MDDDRRRERRTPRIERLLVQIAAAESAPDLAGTTLPSRTSDVSAAGLGLHLDRVLPAGSHIELWVNLDGVRGKFFLVGVVRWVRPEGAGQLHGIELVDAPGDDRARWAAHFG